MNLSSFIRFLKDSHIIKPHIPVEDNISTHYQPFNSKMSRISSISPMRNLNINTLNIQRNQRNVSANSNTGMSALSGNSVIMPSTTRSHIKNNKSIKSIKTVMSVASVASAISIASGVSIASIGDVKTERSINDVYNKYDINGKHSKKSISPNSPRVNVSSSNSPKTKDSSVKARKHLKFSEVNLLFSKFSSESSNNNSSNTNCASNNNNKSNTNMCFKLENIPISPRTNIINVDITSNATILDNDLSINNTITNTITNSNTNSNKKICFTTFMKFIYYFSSMLYCNDNNLIFENKYMKSRVSTNSILLIKDIFNQDYDSQNLKLLLDKMIEDRLVKIYSRISDQKKEDQINLKMEDVFKNPILVC